MKLAVLLKLHQLSLSCAAIAALAAFLLGIAPSAQAAITCEKGIGDTEIQCIVKGAAGLHQALSVTSVLGTAVTVLVEQWTGPCTKIETFSRADNLSVPAEKAATVSVAVPAAAQCASVLLSECKHIEQVNNNGVDKPFACGELLSVKGIAK